MLLFVTDTDWRNAANTLLKFSREERTLGANGKTTPAYAALHKDSPFGQSGHNGKLQLPLPTMLIIHFNIWNIREYEIIAAFLWLIQSNKSKGKEDEVKTRPRKEVFYFNTNELHDSKVKPTKK